MKSFAIICASLALTACGTPAPEPANTVQDVAANEMAGDDVTDVADDSARMEPGEVNESNASVQ